MAGRSRRSVRDEWIDQFDSWTVEQQATALELAEFAHRKAKRKNGKPEPEETDQNKLDLKEAQ